MSEIEETFAFQLRALKIKGWVREYKFHPGRKWRADFCFHNEKLLIECEGGIWTQGRHVRGKGFQDDCEKYNEATLLGWRVLRVTGKQVASGKALEWVERMLSINAAIDRQETRVIMERRQH